LAGSNQSPQSPEYELLPSLNIRNDPLASNWLEGSREVEKIINLTLSLIHPDQFQCGLQMLRMLRKTKKTKGVAIKWQSVCTGVSVISNRLSPKHRDGQGRPEWFDILANFFKDDSPTKTTKKMNPPSFLVSDLGLDLKYSSGTVIGFCGSILEHEVKPWRRGDRVCYAHFMRENVRTRLGANAAGWSERSIYEDFLR
jgi:hypothetical protein